ncbi:MAG: MATE family efflux transporter [Eubacteriales bacterium]|nr:MATE family efflux transporter [Eubacteriales bacterium]
MKSMKREEKNSMVTDLTKGSVPKLLFMFAAPLFVSNALQAIYNIVDMIVVGQVVGGTGMSAVATGGNILSILNFIVMGFASAGQIIIARDVGEKNMDGVRKTIGTMFSLLLSLSVIVSIICYFLRHQLLQLVNTPAEAYAYTMDYTVVCMTGLIFIYGYNIVSAIMRGMGDSKRPFMFVAIASVMNIILDIFFVAGLGMEVIGAALATVIGQGFSFLYALFYLYRHKESFGFDFKARSFIPDMQTIAKLSALGIPMALQSAAISISMTVVAAWVNIFGVVSSACAGILNKLNMMVGILSNSLTTAAASMVGQNLGARKHKRVPKILLWAFLSAFVIESIYVLVLVTMPDLIFSLFTQDQEIITNASIIILPSIVGAYGAATRTFAFGIINGSGNSKLNLLVAIIDGMFARIGVAYLLGWVLEMGPLGFWMGDAIAGFMPMMIGGIFYLSGIWRK